MWLLIDRHAIIIGHSIWDSDFWEVIFYRNLQISTNTLFPRGTFVRTPRELKQFFCSSALTQAEDLMEKNPPLDTLTLLCIINLWCSVYARSDLALRWHKLFFGYPTSLNSPHLLRLQLVISCLSLNAFRQLPESEGGLVVFGYICWRTEYSKQW